VLDLVIALRTRMKVNASPSTVAPITASIEVLKSLP
jgi:hypothetical protein